MAACSLPPLPAPIVDDAGVDGGDDGGTADAAIDAGMIDAGVDAGMIEVDAGMDAGMIDAGMDAGMIDAGMIDAGVDAGMIDAGRIDAGMDAGMIDAGMMDAGMSDAGCVCPLGCGPTGACLRLLPSNLATTRLEDATTPLSTDARIDEPHWVFYDDGRIVAYPTFGVEADGVVIRSADGTTGGGILFFTDDRTISADLAVFQITSLTVPAGTSIRGRGSRAIVILVEGDVRIDGTLSVAGSRALGAGPGGGAGGFQNTGGGGFGGGAGGVNGGLGDDSGGGAGSFFRRGGFGGGPGAMQPPSGLVVGDEDLIPLQAGSGGGGGGTPGGRGGHGGGALQISAGGTIRLGASARIDACGSGGDGGAMGGDGTGGGGGGGGSGGAVLLEAPSVIADMGAVIGANGGSGGQAGALSEVGAFGVDGSLTAQAFTGARGPGGGGGRGSWDDGAAGAGGYASSGGGGGGGAGGRIRINTRDGTETFTTLRTIPTLASGGFTVGAIRIGP